QYLSNGKTFAGATVVACGESPSEIGKGTSPVSVQADISGLVPDGRYRFRLATANKFGPGFGKAGLFGPPILTIRSAQPILYSEATLRGEIEPSGLETKYHFTYGRGESYDQNTPTQVLAPGDGPVAIDAPVTGLAEGTEYHVRLIAENEV